MYTHWLTDCCSLHSLHTLNNICRTFYICMYACRSDDMKRITARFLFIWFHYLKPFSRDFFNSYFFFYFIVHKFLLSYSPLSTLLNAFQYSEKIAISYGFNVIRKMFIILPFSFSFYWCQCLLCQGEIQLGNIRNLNNIIFINTSSVYLFLLLILLLFGASWKSFCLWSLILFGNCELRL